MRQDSEVVIENVSAKSGAGFRAMGNVHISVGHSVRSRHARELVKRTPTVSFTARSVPIYTFFCGSHGQVA